MQCILLTYQYDTRQQNRQARERMKAAQNNDSAKAAMENLPQHAHGTTRDLAGKALADKVYDGAAMGDVVPPKKLLDKS